MESERGEPDDAPSPAPQPQRPAPLAYWRPPPDASSGWSDVRTVLVELVEVLVCFAALAAALFALGFAAG